MHYTYLYNKNSVSVYVDSTKNILYVEILDNTWDRECLVEILEYIKNFWILVSNTNDKYYQIFIWKEVGIYPLDYYEKFLNCLRSLEDIFKSNLNSSCLVNDSDGINILRPILNSYKAQRPFCFVKTLEEGLTFCKNNNLEI